MEKYSWFRFVDAGVIFILLTLSLYHLLVWFGRIRVKGERGHLYFSLITLALSIYSFQYSLWPSSTIYALKSEGTNVPLFNGIIFFVLFLGFTRYLSYLTGYRRIRPWMILLIVLAAVIPLVATYPLTGGENHRQLYLYKDNIAFPVVLYSAAVSLAGLIPFLVRTVRKKLYRDPFHLLVLVALLFLLTFMFIKGALSSLNITRFFYNWQLLFPCLLFSFALTRKFNREFLDLQELKTHLEEKVEERTREMILAREEVEKMHQQRTGLFMNLAHETRTPLTLIRYHLDRYREGRRMDPDLKMISDNIGKLQRDMINFLDSEKLRQGEILYSHNQLVNLTEFVRNKGKFYAPFAHGKKLELVTEAEESLFIQADPFALDRILNNLLMNAVKFTETGTIRLRLCREQEKLILAVSDTGKGIGADRLDGLFEPLDPSLRRKTASQGYGLGLFITRRIVEELEGTIYVTSEEGKGSVFRIELNPADPDSIVHKDKETGIRYQPWLETSGELLPVTARDIVSDPDNTGSGKLIMIVEDNPDLLKILADEFSDGYTVLSAVNGADALRSLSVNPVPDLILSDIMMDVMDGETFLETLRKDSRYASLPFVFLSAADGAETRIRTLSEGAVEFIPKPFSVPELKARVSSLIRFSEDRKAQTVKGAIELLSRTLNDTGRTPAARRQDLFVRRCAELGLSERQREISAWVADGLEYKEIAGRLNISGRTVTRHIQNLYEKLGVHNKVELVNRLFGSSGE